MIFGENHDLCISRQHLNGRDIVDHSHHSSVVDKRTYTSLLSGIQTLTNGVDMTT